MITAALALLRAKAKAATGPFQAEGELGDADEEGSDGIGATQPFWPSPEDREARSRSPHFTPLARRPTSGTSLYFPPDEDARRQRHGAIPVSEDMLSAVPVG